MGQLRVRQAAGGTLRSVLLTLLAYAIAIVMVLPFIWMISASFKYEADIFTYPIQWIPERWNFSNYASVWTGRMSFVPFYWNSIKVTLFSVAGQVLVCSMAAYAFARLRFRGRNAVFMLFLASMMIPTQVTLIPKYVLFSWFSLLNTHTSLILPNLFSAFGIFLLRQFFMGIPTEISEAAKIDGANEFVIYSRIILPLARTAVSSLIILAFVWSWNDYMTPVIFIRSVPKFTIPIALDLYMTDIREYRLIMAAAVSATVPMMIIYFFCQKSFVESISASAVKG